MPSKAALTFRNDSSWTLFIGEEGVSAQARCDSTRTGSKLAGRVTSSARNKASSSGSPRRLKPVSTCSAQGWSPRSATVAIQKESCSSEARTGTRSLSKTWRSWPCHMPDSTKIRASGA
ncbi:hypothetical protein D3C72_1149270 [compost metagenome]